MDRIHGFWSIVSCFLKQANMLDSLGLEKIRSGLKDRNSLINSFNKRYPGQYFFIFTKNHLYIRFAALALSLERIPKPGKEAWPFGPKPYLRFLLVDRKNPTKNDASILNRIKFDHSICNPAYLHNRIVRVLESLEKHSP